MTYDELINTTAYVNTATRRFILLAVGEDQVEALEVLEVREKAFMVRLASAPRIYSGLPRFWMPRAAFGTAKGNEELLGIIQLAPWFQAQMDRQAKQNLNMLF